MGWPFGQTFQLLLVTGQRRDEVAKMRWPDLNPKAGLWTLPRKSTKADRLHEVLLSSLTLEVLKDVKRTSKEYVFSTNGKTPISGYSKAKAKAERIATTERFKTKGQDKPTEKRLAKAMFPNWRLHDLRRTVASGMAKLGIAPHVIEKVLNYSTGAISGVAAVYNRYGYADEKRAALETWARALEAVVHPSNSNVIEMRRRVMADYDRPDLEALRKMLGDINADTFQKIEAAYTERRTALSLPFATGQTYRYPTGGRPEGANCLEDCGKTPAIDYSAVLDRGRGHARAGTTSAGVNGLYDMDANVWEWVDTDSQGHKGTRGGSWCYGAAQIQADYDTSKPRDIAVVYIRFRCIKDIG